MFATLHAGIGVKQTHSYARSLEIFNMYSNWPRRTSLRFSQGLDSILAAIWNNDVHRETCKIVVDVMADHIEACHKLHMAAISA